ncbi:MAG TPA: dihydropteroate synthase [Anaerolineales bacterium]|nr:dihydropteroate synthase [Anaerolineales bacterium]
MLLSDRLKVNGLDFAWGSRTYVMGILNITPDSFSGDGLMQELAGVQAGTLPGPPVDEPGYVSAALTQARSFIAAGVDILDIGGESTRPGAQALGVEEELRRVLPVIRALAEEFGGVISIDTYKAEVARAALAAGAAMVNDVWGLKVDPGLGKVAAEFGAPVILMHNRSSWAHAEIRERLGGRYVGVPYVNMVEDLRRELLESISLAHAAGIPDERIILDPGIGFGKTVDQNLELLNRLDEIRTLGYPVLLGPSRKSFIGYTLDLPPDQRLEGTAAAVAVGIVRGADIVRVHDAEFMVRLARMTDAIVRERPASEQARLH